MKLLRRNTTEFEYLPYIGMVEEITEDGEHTGELHPGYGDPILKRGNISAPSGMVNQTFYGEDVRYTHTLVMDTPDSGLCKGGVIRWKGELYDIRAVKPSINATSAALRKQTVDHAEGEDE